MEAAVENLTCAAFLITGLSHLLQPKIWARFFIAVREQGEMAPFLNGYVHMPLGLIIIAFHNVWTWPQVIVTLVGWSLALKGAVNFLAPSIATKGLARVSMERAWEFQVAGLVALAIAGVIAWVRLN
jgi:uncharacterized protein YjeT (DUF2065 family)